VLKEEEEEREEEEKKNAEIERESCHGSSGYSLPFILEVWY